MTDLVPHNVIMDVDPGVDDAMALALAVGAPAIALLGVTTVAGNVARDMASANARKVLDELGAADIPVYAGMSRPLARAHIDATEIHGDDGLGGALADAEVRPIERMTAPEFIVQSVRAQPGEITLLFVGPLTNLAVALMLEPELPSLVKNTVIMGGAFTVSGNVTPEAEFNIAVDPEAAQFVARSALAATWVGLDVTRHVEITREQWDSLSGADAPTSQLVREVCRWTFESRNGSSFTLHDPLAVGVVIDPRFVTTVPAAISVDTSMRASFGMTRMLVDERGPQHFVARAVDADAFHELFASVLNLPFAGEGQNQGE